MKSFMTLGSISRGMEVDEVPNEEDIMPFPREDTVTMIYNGSSSLEKRHMCNTLNFEFLNLPR
jgi:hypothetical protein